MSEKSRFESGYIVSKLGDLDLSDPNHLRQLRLLLQLPEPKPLTPFRVFAEEWFEKVAARYVCPDNERRYLERLNRELGHLDEVSLLPSEIQRALNEMQDLGPNTKNKIKGCGARVVDYARLDGRWTRGNPFEVVKRLKEPKRDYQILSLDEMRRVLPCVRQDRMRLFRVAAVLGARSGELFALTKEDVDLERGTVHVHRSHGRAQTKTGKARRVPIPACILGDFRAAMSQTRGDLIFPSNALGERFRTDAKLTQQLAHAMARAGLVLGFETICRRKGCHFQGESRFREFLKCPKCGYQLWLRPRVRYVQFRDLRHSCATLHREAGCDPLVIKLLLGHSSQSPTDDIYTHLSLDYQAKELAKLKI